MSSLRWLSAALALAALACSSSNDEAPKKQPIANCDPAADAKAAERESCSFGPGALPKETLGCSTLGKKLPFEHVLLIMQENRSFDHYFQKLPEYGQPDVDVAPDGTTNPAPDGTPVPFVHADSYCFSDTNHEWSGSHTEWNAGKNDGFAKANAEGGDPTGARAMTYYDDTDIPFYYWLANTFATGDRYFCSLLGPTWPNRMYFYAATSFGNMENVPVIGDVPRLMRSLEDAGKTWKEYRTNLATTGLLTENAFHSKESLVDISEFEQDLKNGTLPDVAWVGSRFSEGGALESSEHPPGDMQVGEQWVHDKLELLMQSPYWENTVVFIVYDEHGGLYDHVPPPKACAPDATAPKKDADLGGFDQLGFRTPVFVVSPYTKPHYVSHVVHDHTSVVRFVEALFDLPALTGRDANADAMLDFFDFQAAAFMTPPELPAAPIDQAKLDACLKIYPEKP